MNPKKLQVTSPLIYERIKEALEGKLGSVVSSSKVKELLKVKYGINESSVIPSDYCYNRINAGIKFDKHIFEYIERGKYKYLGENYSYTGLIFSKPTGQGKEIIVGEWKNGKKFMKENS
jgi:hypothetical protein